MYIQALGDGWLYTEIERPERVTDLLPADHRDHTYEPSPSVDGSESNTDNGLGTYSNVRPPSPPLQIQLTEDEWLCFTETHLAQQKEWLRLIHDRLEVVDDDEVAEGYQV